ncbi:hypothetical protein [Nocardia sp. NPDC047038]|uniref:hypothetical protein n=1 Tax=Nocardia sp. NPDC047038 TaxID=3154338 RepID=UPI0033E6B813
MLPFGVGSVDECLVYFDGFGFGELGDQGMDLFDDGGVIGDDDSFGHGRGVVRGVG